MWMIVLGDGKAPSLIHLIPNGSTSGPWVSLYWDRIGYSESQGMWGETRGWGSGVMGGCMA